MSKKWVRCLIVVKDTKGYFLSFVPRKLVKRMYAAAGLLTYSGIRMPSRLLSTVAFCFSAALYGAYSNGLVQDLHLIPF